MRKTPADAQLVSADSFGPVMAQLLEERDIGLLLGCATLLLGICVRAGSGEWWLFAAAGTGIEGSREQVHHAKHVLQLDVEFKQLLGVYTVLLEPE